jgi:VIT1/CCC1 family predicted Fe2+/Mn2+ transporter
MMPDLEQPVLSPLDRTSEVLFGLIMALTFTGSLGVATADRAEVRSMLIGALGCNIAWGLVDAVMYLMGVSAERGRSTRLLQELRHTGDAGRARRILASALPDPVATAMEPGELDSLRNRLATVPIPESRLGLVSRDFRAAGLVFLLVFLATLPVALPFLFIPETRLALRVSNGIALVMLFIGGWRLGGYAGRSQLAHGVVYLAVGVVLVWATILLGG